MSKEAMKLALEALKRMKGYGNTFAYRSHEQNPHEQVCEAITALEALAEQKSGIKQVIELYDSPDQPSQQELVAWGVDWGKAGDIPCVSIIKRLPGGGIEVMAVEYAPYSYTSPPAQRTWVGLTDEEVMIAAYQAGFDIHEDYENEDDPEAMHWWTPDGEACDDSLLKLRDLIEAKLKEKNT